MNAIMERNHIYYVLEQLEKRYPEVSENGSTLQYDDVASEFDPFFMMLKKFREEMRESDRPVNQLAKHKATINQIIYSYPSVREVCSQLGFAEEDFRQFLARNPKLREKLLTNRRKFAEIVIYDIEAKRSHNCTSVKKAAEELGVSQHKLQVALTDRHNQTLYDGKYMAKRRLWYELDGGI